MKDLSCKKLLFIAGGPEQVGTIRWAVEQGIQAFVVDINENAPGFKYAQATLTCDIKDRERILDFAKKYSVNGVTSICLESTMHTTAYLVEKLGLAGLSRATAENVTNKYRMRELFKKAGLAIPEYRLITPKLLEDEKFPGFDRPWVVKPVDNAGSRGIMLINDRKELKRAYDNALTFTERREVLIEKFIPGKEISVEGFVINGKLIVETLSDKNRSPLPYLFDCDITYPSCYHPEIQQDAISQTRAAISALGIRDGPVHEELLVTPDGEAVIVEIAGRGPGSKIYTEIIPHVSGLYPNRLQVMQALECLPERIEREDRLKGATIYWFGAQENARIEKFHGFEKVKNIAGVYECRMYKKEGDIVEKCISGAQRIGQLITMADTLEKAIASQKEALESFWIELENLN